jgi:hypothetical protein
MRRIPMVSYFIPIIAAAVLVGHVVPHLLLQRCAWQPPADAPPSLPPKPWTAGPTAPALPPAPPLVTRTCRLQPPLTEADWKPMLAALRPLVAREDLQFPVMASVRDEFLRRFEACGVDVFKHTDYVLVATHFDGHWGMWMGARFRKTPHGWTALQMDEGDL